MINLFEQHPIATSACIFFGLLLGVCVQIIILIKHAKDNYHPHD